MDADFNKYNSRYNEYNIEKSGLFEPNTSVTDLKSRTLPRGFLSEYKHSYLTNSTPKHVYPRIKDTLSFGNKSLLQDSFVLENIKNNPSNEQINLKSKQIERLQNMLPDGSLSWYKAEHNFYGSDQNLDKKVESSNDEPIKKPKSSFKNSYLKNFEELNKGFVDSYTLSKGGALLQVRNEMQSAKELSANNNKQENVPRNHDLRSVWIPKKFEGRNMFVSHIDSTIFPEKKSQDLETSYNQNFDSDTDARKSFERPNYERVDKSVRYVMNYENKYIPSIRWYPKDSQKPVYNKEKENELTPKSIYQADFDPPTTKSAPIPGTLIQAKVDPHQYTLEQIQKRRNEINELLAKSSVVL